MEPAIELTQEQLAAWSKAPRPEIVEALISRGPLSVAELAAALGRKPRGLYYHLRALETVGLVRVHEVRRAKRREEAVYAAVSRSLQVRPDLRDPGYRKAVQDSVSATFRSLDRTHRQVLEAFPTQPGLNDLSTVLIAPIRLRDEDAREVLRLIAELHQKVKSSHDPEAKQAFTFCATLLALPMR